MNFFIYARKSTDDEERQILSIQAQLDELRELARNESLTVAREYIEAQTAKEPGRPVFRRSLGSLWSLMSLWSLGRRLVPESPSGKS